MNNPITSEEVASQFAKAIQLMLEWAKQEMIVPTQTRTVEYIRDQKNDVRKIPPDSQRLLKVKEVAEILQVSRSHAYQMMQRGEIPMVRVGSAVRVRTTDLDDFIKNSLHK
jgi:excisionase family DNA binding protein